MLSKVFFYKKSAVEALECKAIIPCYISLYFILSQILLPKLSWVKQEPQNPTKIVNENQKHFSIFLPRQANKPISNNTVNSVHEGNESVVLDNVEDSATTVIN